MKNSIILLALMAATCLAFGQVDPDQNPNYKQSMDKYMAVSDSLTANLGTTYQDTYKAIDDYEDRIAAKRAYREQRLAYRHERQMARIQNRNQPQYYPYGDYGYGGWGYGNNGYGRGNYNYGPRYNWGYGYGSNGFRPYVRPSFGVSYGYPFSGSIGGRWGGSVCLGF